MDKNQAPKKPLLREQQRALHAYTSVASVKKEFREDYESAVKDFGTNILRGGLCAALAAVQRLGGNAGEAGSILLGHLVSAGVPGLEGATAEDLVRRVRELDTEGYMMATREFLKVANWLKRAVQATAEESGDA